jgi:hypothetical protein
VATTPCAPSPPPPPSQWPPLPASASPQAAAREIQSGGEQIAAGKTEQQETQEREREEREKATAKKEQEEREREERQKATATRNKTPEERQERDRDSERNVENMNPPGSVVTPDSSGFTSEYMRLALLAIGDQTLLGMAVGNLAYLEGQDLVCAAERNAAARVPCTSQYTATSQPLWFRYGGKFIPSGAVHSLVHCTETLFLYEQLTLNPCSRGGGNSGFRRSSSSSSSRSSKHRSSSSRGKP